MEQTLSSFSRDVADIFAENSDNDKTFYGFSDCEISGGGDLKSSESDDAAVKRKIPDRKPAHRFTIRVALRSRSNNAQSEDEGEKGEWPENDGKTEFNLKEKGECGRPSPPKSDSDSEAEGYLEKRALNIKANKAMLAQLMADLQRMPSALQKSPQVDRPKGQRSWAPPSTPAASGGRRYPERASRRQTRSMGNYQETPVPQKEKDLELTLEEELMEVRQAPRRRGNPRINKSKPHIVRPVEEIAEDELNLVADGMTDKVYNSATGTTCHQCRQKTVDTKTCCRNTDCRGIQGQFCGPCLRNRYGEDVRKALLDPVPSLPSTPRDGGVLHAVESATAASVVSGMVVALLASYFLWPSTMASMMSTPTSTAFGIN
ncbi:cell division cycle-associated protein 7-like isoform X1 [Brienomyrus brachyistius]|uniref:cell division cycle-associated protein 7-like isoform X1 n=1 Tax=Brienomyrus brachyistius TaxID=42636 RepID=UPI0020B3571E|nr:cell division cycle-associated protein 7-like isoform X1 [Brienomyrus brachyistius]